MSLSPSTRSMQSGSDVAKVTHADIPSWCSNFHHPPETTSPAQTQALRSILVLEEDPEYPKRRAACPGGPGGAQDSDFRLCARSARRHSILSTPIGAPRGGPAGRRWSSASSGAPQASRLRELASGFHGDACSRSTVGALSIAERSRNRPEAVRSHEVGGRSRQTTVGGSSRRLVTQFVI